MTEKKKPPQPPLPASGPPPSEDELKFGDELPVLPIRNAVLFYQVPSRPSTWVGRNPSPSWRTSTTSRAP